MKIIKEVENNEKKLKKKILQLNDERYSNKEYIKDVEHNIRELKDEISWLNEYRQQNKKYINGEEDDFFDWNTHRDIVIQDI